MQVSANSQLQMQAYNKTQQLQPATEQTAKTPQLLKQADWETLLQKLQSDGNITIIPADPETTNRGKLKKFLTKWCLDGVKVQEIEDEKWETAYGDRSPFIDKDGTKKVPVMIHRALFGSLERFIGILIENYAGKFPFWIAPLQTIVIPISEEFDVYAKEVNKKINNAGIISEVDLKNHNLNYKIREHSLSKIPLLLICGKKEVDSNSVTIRRLDTNKQENMELNLFLKKFSALNKAPSN